MKKIVPALLVLIILIIGGGIYFSRLESRKTETPLKVIDIAAFKTYTAPETGFSIKYPPLYRVEAEPIATGTEWGSRTLFTIYDPSNTSRNEFHIGPAGVTVQKQPVGADGKIYHTIVEYQESGTAALMVQGASDPDGELVTLDGLQALLYHFPQGDATDAPTDEYIFIKNDLIYQIGFNANDPYKNAMLQSITWQE